MIFPWKLFPMLVATGLGVVLISALVSYSTTISSETAHLQALSQSLAKFISSVAQFDSVNNKNFSEGGSRGATLSQISDAHLEHIGFGATGEFVIGERVEDRIQFLIPSRVLGGPVPAVDMNAKAAEPMRRALLGLSGVMEAQDYQGLEVLAWYETIPELNAGLVAKINKAEILALFRPAMLLGCLAAVLVSLFSCLLFGVRAGAMKANKGIAKGGVSRTIVLLALCFALVGGASATTVMAYLYPSGVERQKEELMSLIRGMASLIDSVAVFDIKNTAEGDVSRAQQATISQMKHSLRTNPGFGVSGEIVLGQRKQENMVFHLPSRFTGLANKPVPYAEPMRRANAQSAKGRIGSN
jgi:hypothetical protein